MSTCPGARWCVATTTWASSRLPGGRRMISRPLTGRLFPLSTPPWTRAMDGSNSAAFAPPPRSTPISTSPMRVKPAGSNGGSPTPGRVRHTPNGFSASQTSRRNRPPPSGYWPLTGDIGVLKTASTGFATSSSTKTAARSERGMALKCSLACEAPSRHRPAAPPEAFAAAVHRQHDSPFCGQPCTGACGLSELIRAGLDMRQTPHIRAPQRFWRSIDRLSSLESRLHGEKQARRYELQGLCR